MIYECFSYLKHDKKYTITLLGVMKQINPSENKKKTETTNKNTTCFHASDLCMHSTNEHVP